jgi:hypothetical protein
MPEGSMKSNAGALAWVVVTALMLDCSLTPVTSRSATDGGELPGSSNGSSGSGSSGSSAEAGMASDAFIAATIGVGSASPSNICNVGSSTDFLDIGVGTTAKPVTVKDGLHNAGGGFT